MNNIRLMNLLTSLAKFHLWNMSETKSLNIYKALVNYYSTCEINKLDAQTYADIFYEEYIISCSYVNIISNSSSSSSRNKNNK